MASSTGTSDYNLREISTKELEDILKATIEFGMNDADAPAVVFIAGRRGSGKTFIAKDAIADTGCVENYINISMQDRVDIGGYPNLLSASEGKKYVSYMLPQFFEQLIEGDKPGVLLLDEVDKADPALYSSLLDLCQFKKIGNKKLPNLKAIIMTGNLQSEGGHRPIPPLLDRTIKYLLTVRTDQWINWAGSKGKIHPSITAFISDHSDQLYGEIDDGDNYASSSPRGWHNLSKFISFGEERKWGPNALINMAYGCVGKQAGIRYQAYFEHYQVLLPIAEKIMKGENVAEFEGLDPSKKMVACMIVCSRLSRLLDAMHEKKEAKHPTQSKTVVKFLKDVDPEMALTSIRGQIGLDRVIKADLLQSRDWNDLVGGMVKKANGG